MLYERICYSMKKDDGVALSGIFTGTQLCRMKMERFRSICDESA